MKKYIFNVDFVNLTLTFLLNRHTQEKCSLHACLFPPNTTMNSHTNHNYMSIYSCYIHVIFTVNLKIYIRVYYILI